jgi:hypothetical protein
MEAGHDSHRAKYETELERTVQELNSRKRQLEDALHQVRFKTMLPMECLLKTCQ